MKQMALLLSCIGSSVLMTSAGHALDKPNRLSDHLTSQLDNAATDAPFDLRAPVPDKAGVKTPSSVGSLLSGADPAAGSQALNPVARAAREPTPAKVDESALRFCEA